MYPTVVIVLVETQRSMTDVWEINLSNASKLVGPVASQPHAATLGHLSLAVGQMDCTTDNDSEFQGSRVLQSQDRQEHGLEKVILEVKKSSG